jgi:hypothetical protein
MSTKPAEREQAALAKVEKLARVMDGFFLDPLLGLGLPGAGDLVGAAAGLYALAVAWRLRVPKVLIARMMLNLSVDLLGGSIPVVGDIWDFFFRAHTRNAALLRARLAQGPGRSSPWDWLAVAGAALVLLLALAAPVVVALLVIRHVRA